MSLKQEQKIMKENQLEILDMKKAIDPEELICELGKKKKKKKKRPKILP